MVYDKNKFKNTGPINASFDFFELATNQAAKVFYASRNNIGTVDILSPVQVGSDKLLTLRTGAGSTEANYDYIFTVPLIVRGNFFIEGTVELERTTGTIIGDTDFRILKVAVGGAEEELVGTVSFERMSKGEAGKKSGTFTISGTITRTPFKIGDKIRLEAIYTLVTTSGSGVCFWWHDPLSRGDVSDDFKTVATPATTLKFIIPFEPTP